MVNVHGTGPIYWFIFSPYTNLPFGVGDRHVFLPSGNVEPKKTDGFDDVPTGISEPKSPCSTASTVMCQL